MTQFLTTDTALSAYMAYPKFLLEMIDLSETAKLVYIVLLDRARVSQAKGSWADESGNVFIYYPIRDLAEAVHKSEMSVKTALAALTKLQSEIAKVESALATLEETEKKNTSKLQKALRQYKIYREKAKAFNPAVFWAARLKLRPTEEKSAEAKLRSSYGNNFRESTFLSAVNDTDTATDDHLDVQTTNKSSASKTIHKPHIR